MEIKLEEIERLARLSKLSFDKEKLNSFKHEFERITDFVEQVKSLDVVDCDNVDGVLNIDQLREDEIKPSMPVSEILSNAPEKDDGAFIVPKVVE